MHGKTTTSPTGHAAPSPPDGARDASTRRAPGALSQALPWTRS